MCLAYHRDLVHVAEPHPESRAASVALNYTLACLDPTSGYLGWLAFRRRVLTQWLTERGSLDCYYCGKTPLLVEGPKNQVATLDHYIPRAVGGPRFDLNNLVVACARCNHKKADQVPA